MPSVSKAQQRFMGMVHAAQKGDMENPSPEVTKAADSMSDKSAKDFASTKHKGLPNKVEECDDIATANKYASIKHDGQPDYIPQLKELIKKIIKEKDLEEMNVTGNVEGYNTPFACSGKDGEKKKGKKQADLTGYTVVNENRWLELKQDESTAQSKIGRGISNINKQLKEMERFLNWYGKIKNESGVSNKSYWKRTNSHIYSIQERLLKLDQKIRQISE